MSTMIDEILIDANIFGTKGQNSLLIMIARNPQVGYFRMADAIPSPYHRLYLIISRFTTTSLNNCACRNPCFSLC